MIHLEKINGENVWDILKLKVSDSQKSFVAGNDISIIEASAAITSNGYAFPFGYHMNQRMILPVTCTTHLGLLRQGKWTGRN